MTARWTGPSASPMRGSVIVAEDDDLLREFFVVVLEHGGYQVLPARDGQDALDLLSAGGDVSVLITDIEMPRIDGLELACRARQRRRELRVLYVSSWERAEVADRTVPGSRFLRKPC